MTGGSCDDVNVCYHSSGVGDAVVVGEEFKHREMNRMLPDADHCLREEV